MPTHQRTANRVIDVVLWTPSSEPCVKRLQCHRLRSSWDRSSVFRPSSVANPQSFLRFRMELNVETCIEIER
jgi:hypothetical protein